MPKKYIVYRYFNAIPYIEKHLGELKNIEIFTRENKIKLEINVNMRGE